MKSGHHSHITGIKLKGGKIVKDEEGRATFTHTEHKATDDHKGNSLAKYWHKKEISRSARKETAASLTKDHITKKSQANASNTETEPNPKLHPTTMRHAEVKKLYTKHLTAAIAAHRDENPGLPKGKVRKGFAQTALPGVYRKLKTAGWDSPSRLPGLRNNPATNHWHKACTTCAKAADNVKHGLDPLHHLKGKK